MLKDFLNWLFLPPEAKSDFREWAELVGLYLLFSAVVVVQGELPLAWVLAGVLLLGLGISKAGRELLRIALIAAILVFGVIRPYVVQAFYIPSRSMENTLQINDHIFVNKFIYYLRSPRRWETIVFEYPPSPDKDFVKRLIALPGDKVELREHNLFLDGDTVVRQRVGGEIFLHGYEANQLREAGDDTLRFAADNLQVNNRLVLGEQNAETPLNLHGDVMGLYQEANNHEIKVAARSWDNSNRSGLPADFGPIHVPEVGERVDLTDLPDYEQQFYISYLKQLHPDDVVKRDGVIYLAGQPLQEIEIEEPLYFVLGDNRGHSEDSRYWGFVPQSKLLGRAFFIYWPLGRVGLVG